MQTGPSLLPRLTLALLLLVAGCKEDKPDPGPQLPPETQTGAGTLGFKIGDKIYVAKLVTCTQLEPGTFEVNAGSSIADGWTCYVAADSIFATGSFVLDTLLRPGAILPIDAGIYHDINRGCLYSTQSINYKGRLDVTRVDLTARILSGRFSFRANSVCGSVELTDGRFDVKF